MVTTPRLHTSAAHSPAGDGNQAIKIWTAVSLYLLVTWLAAGGLIALQPITYVPTLVLDIAQFAPATAVLVLMATRRVAAPRSTHTRRLCLTVLARMGWELHAIATFAGHRSTDSTLRYIQLSGRELHWIHGEQRGPALWRGRHSHRLGIWARRAGVVR